MIKKFFSLFTISFIILILYGTTYAVTVDLTAKKGADFEYNIYVSEGSTNKISSFALYDPTHTTVFSTAHGRTNGAKLVINDSDYYNGTYVISNATTDTFVIPIEFEATESTAKWSDAFDLSDYTAEAKVWNTTRGTEIADLGATVQGDGTSGWITISLTDTEVNAIRIGDYLWDLYKIYTDGVRDIVASGVFSVVGYGTPITSNASTVFVSDQDIIITLVGGRGPILQLSSSIAGRSLTFVSDIINADAELYTDKDSLYIENPIAESFEDFYWFMSDVTITYVRCKTDTGTIDINFGDGSNTDILLFDLVCDSNGQTTCQSGCDVNTINGTYSTITALTEEVDLDFTNPVGSPTNIRVHLGYTKND